jgi:hypothetical protein
VPPGLQGKEGGALTDPNQILKIGPGIPLK